MHKQKYIIIILVLFVTFASTGCKQTDEDLVTNSNVANLNKSLVNQSDQGNKIQPPPQGCYVGMFPGWGDHEDEVDSQALEDFEELVGKSVAIAPFSNFWGKNSSVSQQLEEIDSYGAIPLLRLMPWGETYWDSNFQADYSMQNIINGDFDQYLQGRAKEIKDFGKPVMVTFAVEPNGDWFPWSGEYQGGSKTIAYGDESKANGPERFIGAFRHIIALFQNQGVGNVTWLWHVNAGSYPEDDWNDLTAYYPGDDYVDWIGLSVYGAQYIDQDWEDFEDILDPAYNKVTSLYPSKPLMLAEWGVGEWPSSGDKALWYEQALEKLQSKYGQIKMAIVYHEKWKNDDGTWSDLRINSSSATEEAFKKGVASDYFEGKIE